MTEMNKYLVRYNTKHNDKDPKWRVFQNGIEYLVDGVIIVPISHTEESIEDGLRKHNICCYAAHMVIDEHNIAKIG